jgi:hypothetical protein
MEAGVVQDRSEKLGQCCWEALKVEGGESY